jgi:L-amino acid N-acyltransferase YncA
VYTTDAKQQPAQCSDDVVAYDQASPPPMAVRRSLRRCAGHLGAGLMLGRLRRHGAVLLCRIDGDVMLGYGWIQTWKPLRREFGWLAGAGAVCLGPYWTNPLHRGKGIYGGLLSHSLAECRRRGWRHVYIWAEAHNAASVRGIEKAGFRSLGRHRVTMRWFGLRCRHEPLTRETAADSQDVADASTHTGDDLRP